MQSNIPPEEPFVAISLVLNPGSCGHCHEPFGEQYCHGVKLPPGEGDMAFCSSCGTYSVLRSGTFHALSDAEKVALYESSDGPLALKVRRAFLVRSQLPKQQ